MAVVIKEGNVFDSDADIICHQVNCRSVMGSGVAKEVRERYPEVYYAYLDRCYNAITNHNHTLLGTAQFVKVSDNRCIVNCFAQDNYGYDGKQYTDLAALQHAFATVATKARSKGFKVAMPYKIGCCRGGADWDTVKKIIDVTFQDVDVELWKLEGK